MVGMGDKKLKVKVQNAKLRTWPDYILKNHPNPLQEENYISGKVCDHYNRFREDFDIAKSLGQNAFRFSIEWSRVEPEEGDWNEKEIKHYRQVVQALRERGLEPFVTLWHWTLPVWLSKKGGWAHKNSVNYFTRYAAKMADALPQVRYWITLNETNTYTALGYLKGIEPPGRFSLLTYFRANHHLALAHHATRRVLKEKNKNNLVGVAHNIIFFHRSRLKSFFWNHRFIRSLKASQDFIGVNYYRSNRLSQEVTDAGWGIDPQGLTGALRLMSRYKLPLYVTENGIADSRDALRPAFIRSHIKAVGAAMAEGVPVRGYFYWSLLDNFEMPRIEGFWPRFGLVEIDYKTMERKIRPSAYEYKKIIEAGGLT